MQHATESVPQPSTIDAERQAIRAEFDASPDHNLGWASFLAGPTVPWRGILLHVDYEGRELLGVDLSSEREFVAEFGRPVTKQRVAELAEKILAEWPAGFDAAFEREYAAWAPEAAAEAEMERRLESAGGY